MSYGLIQETYTKSLSSSQDTLFIQDVLNAEFIMIEVDVSGSPLSSFSIKMRGHSASQLRSMFSSADDYLNPKGLLRGASGDMTTINGDGGWVMLDTRGISQVSVTASSTSTSDLTIRIGG